MQSKPQNPPKKHHYIPESYQKKWVYDNSKNELIVFTKQHGVVRSRSKSPGATGYIKLLYAMQNLSPDEAQMVETDYMAPVDDLAAVARDALLARRELTWRERGAWVQFLMSLWLRTPEELILYKLSYRQQSEKYREALSAQYLDKRQELDPPTYSEYLENIGEGGADKIMMRLFLSMMTNKNLAKILFEMQWVCIDVSKADFKLMTSDRPLVMPYGLGRDFAYIAIPLSPDTLFIAMRNEQILARMQDRGFSGIVADINAVVVGQAYTYVYAFDDAQARFVQNRMSRLPRWSMIERMMAKFDRDEGSLAKS